MPPEQLPAGWWGVRFFQRHEADDPSRSVPAREALKRWPAPVRERMGRILRAVAAAPPPAWAGRGTWEAMEGQMAGWYEARLRFEKRLYRLFCLLERDFPGSGLERPSIIVVEGMDKANETAFRPADYAHVRDLGDEYRRRIPRSLLGR